MFVSKVSAKQIKNIYALHDYIDEDLLVEELDLSFFEAMEVIELMVQKGVLRCDPFGEVSVA